MTRKKLLCSRSYSNPSGKNDRQSWRIRGHDKFPLTISRLLLSKAHWCQFVPAWQICCHTLIRATNSSYYQQRRPTHQISAVFLAHYLPKAKIAFAFQSNVTAQTTYGRKPSKDWFVTEAISEHRKQACHEHDTRYGMHFRRISGLSSWHSLTYFLALMRRKNVVMAKKLTHDLLWLSLKIMYFDLWLFYKIVENRS